MKPNNDYTIRLHSQASDEMNEVIRTFIRFGSIQGAKRIKEKFVKAIDRIGVFPYSSPVIRDPQLAEAGFRTVVVENYIMIYKVNEEAGEIVFYHVFDGRKDYFGLMRSMYFN